MSDSTDKILEGPARFFLSEVRERLTPARGVLDRLLWRKASEAGLRDEDLLDGCRLGGYKFGKLLGVGAAGVVFEATSEEFGPCAVKVMRKPADEAPESMAFFRREVGIGQAIDHPCVLRTYDALEDGSARFLVMERVIGHTLREELGRPLGVEETLSFFEPVAGGLQAAHNVGVIHRDLKPENVMIGNGHQVKILDFGLAKWTRDESLTMTNQFKGTINYCAPEQIVDSKSTTPACDQFALGLMVFEALTANLPYPMESKNPLMNLMERLDRDPARLREYREDLNRETDEVVAKMLSRTPEERFESVESAMAALKAGLRAD